ncbi:MAG: serine/threonine-protein kinase [Elusimicrobiota bacterium]|jgi:serine/threonine-protein kinase
MPSVETPDPLLGRTVGTCRIEAVIGGGGMGTVYRAWHLPLDRPVALKIIAPELMADPHAVESFLAEARNAARIDDPHIVQVHEVGKDAGLYYIVMQLAGGCTLEDKLRRDGPLSPAEAKRVIQETARGLQAAHRLGVVHRDIKPGNVILGLDGSVRIMDFGLSGIADRDKDAAAVGSFGFMSPEQGLGAPPDPRMDIYSLGAMYFYLLAGRPPYVAAHAADVVVQHRDASIPDVREFRREVSAAAAGLIRRLMAKDPAQRPADIAEVLRALDSYQLLIDTDSSGSPFKLLPPPVAAQTGFDASAGFVPAVSGAGAGRPCDADRGPWPAAAHAPGSPLPPPLAPSLKRGQAWPMAAVIVALLFGLHARKLAGPDMAAAGFLAMVVAARMFFRPQWRLSWRLLSGISAFAAMAGIFYLYGASGSGPSAAAGWDFEIVLLAVLGLASAAGSWYLGLVEVQRQDRALAYGLLAVSAGCWFLAALSLRIPSGQDWWPGIRSGLSADVRIFIDSLGVWRWGGAAMLSWLWWSWSAKRAPMPGPVRKANVANWNR